MRGATTASPLATTRTALISSAGATSLSRKAEAPAWSPANAYSSRSKVVRMMILARGTGRLVMARVASIPSSTGIRTSISTTSGARSPDLADRLGAVGRLAHNLQIILALQDQAEAHPQERLVIHQQDADRSGPAHRFPLTHVPLLSLSPFQCRTACTRQP